MHNKGQANYRINIRKVTAFRTEILKLRIWY